MFHRSMKSGGLPLGQPPSLTITIRLKFTVAKSRVFFGFAPDICNVAELDFLRQNPQDFITLFWVGAKSA
jgi:hypothetical protein